MRLVTRVYRLVWGSDVDPALRPVLAVALVGATAGSASWVFIGIWAKKHLGASDTQLGLAFLAGALLAGGASYVGGHISDHVGRRPMILAGWGGQTLMLLGFLLVGKHTVAGLVFASLAPAMGAVGGAADTAMVADLVPPERQEAGYAAVRVAHNLGVTCGPPLGGLLLLAHSWPVFFLGASVLAACAWAVAWRYVPRGGAYAPKEPPQRGSAAVILRDRPFLLFLGSGVLASMTYVAYEVLLPISLVTTYGLAPSLWGVLVIVNPALVVLLQLPLIRWTAGVSATLKLGIAMPLMGLPFLLLPVSHAIPVVLVVVTVFVFGEMLWIPTSQTAVAAFAPADIRGAYMGFFGSSWAVAWALGPFLGLQVRGHWGDTTMWVAAASISVLAGIAGAAAVRGRRVVTREAVASTA
ncbi:MAG TPA: MFS transporter [Gaiellaceae bacterium]